ncbi:MAG TPA: response regulator, partial [Calditrichaeota bacterium]|nr:response regulator [Calditrichota bacterium]
MSDFNILLIDDEPAQITSIKSFLKRRDYSVLTANSGSEGMAIIREGNIDLVFTDFRMPDMNGLEVVKAANDFNPELPVVVVTAFSDTEDAVKVMKEGAFDYLSKPVNLDELEALVKKAKEHNYLVSENRLLKEQIKEKYKFDAIISQSG